MISHKHIYLPLIFFIHSSFAKNNTANLEEGYYIENECTN